jgi:hypothetical protein
MSRKRHTPEQIIRKLRAAEVEPVQNPFGPEKVSTMSPE